MIKSFAFAFVIAGLAALSIGIRIGQGVRSTDAVQLAIVAAESDRMTLRARPHQQVAQVGAVCRKGVLYCDMSEFGTIGTGCCGCGFCGFWSDD